MANVAPAGTGGGAGWYVYGVAYPKNPSTAVPVVVQGQQYGPGYLAGPFATKLAAQAWAAASKLFGPGKTNISPPADAPVTPPSVTPASGGTGTNQPSADPSCLMKFPGFSGFFGLAKTNGFCILRKTEVRALIGGGLIIGAGILGIAGLVLAGVKLAAPLARKVPPVTPVTAAAAGAGAAIDRGQERHDESVARQVEARTRDSAKGPALRDERPHARQLASPRVSESQRREPVPF